MFNGIEEPFEAFVAQWLHKELCLFHKNVFSMKKVVLTKNNMVNGSSLVLL